MFRLLVCVIALFSLSSCDDGSSAKERERQKIVEISRRPIHLLDGGDVLTVGRSLVRKGIRGCGEMYGVPVNDRRSEWLVFCSNSPSDDMRKDFSHAAWSVYTVWSSSEEVMAGNHTSHCGVIASKYEDCPAGLPR